MAALVIVPGAGDNAPAANAVTINKDGTVTIEMADLNNPASLVAANKVLADAGIRAQLVSDQPKCEPGTEMNSDLPEPDGLIVPIPMEQRKERIVTFQPDRIPADMTLVVLAPVDETDSGGSG